MGKPNKKKWSRKRKIIFCILSIVCLIILIAVFPLINIPLMKSFDPPKLKISKETTYLTDVKLDSDGLPDYAAWLNEQNSKGVTPENNFVVSLIKICGADLFVDQEYQEKFLALIGISVEDLPQPIYIGQDKYLAEKKISGENWMPHDKVCKPWLKKDMSLEAEYLVANKEALDAIVVAAGTDKYYSPQLNDVMLSWVFSLSELRSIAKTLAARANMNIGEGNLAAAWRDAIAIYKMGGMLLSSRSHYAFLIENLVGVAIRGLADEVVRSIIKSPALTMRQAKKFQVQWRRLARKTDIEALFFGERLYGLDLLIRWNAGKVSTKDIFWRDQNFWYLNCLKSVMDINRLLVLQNQEFDEIISIISDNDPIDCVSVFDSHYAKYHNLWPGDANEDKISSVLSLWTIPLLGRERAADLLWIQIQNIFPDINGTAMLLFKSDELKHQVNDIAFSLQQYKITNKNYPESLRQLVPEYIKAVPVNHMDGRAFIYNHREGCYDLKMRNSYPERFKLLRKNDILAAEEE